MFGRSRYDYDSREEWNSALETMYSDDAYKILFAWDCTFGFRAVYDGFFDPNENEKHVLSKISSFRNSVNKRTHILMNRNWMKVDRFWKWCFRSELWYAYCNTYYEIAKNNHYNLKFNDLYYYKKRYVVMHWILDKFLWHDVD